MVLRRVCLVIIVITSITSTSVCPPSQPSEQINYHKQLITGGWGGGTCYLMIHHADISLRPSIRFSLRQTLMITATKCCSGLWPPDHFRLHLINHPTSPNLRLAPELGGGVPGVGGGMPLVQDGVKGEARAAAWRISIPPVCLACFRPRPQGGLTARRPPPAAIFNLTPRLLPKQIKLSS